MIRKGGHIHAGRRWGVLSCPRAEIAVEPTLSREKAEKEFWAWEGYDEEVSFQEFVLNFGVSQRIALRDIRLLKQAGVLEARWDRKRRGLCSNGILT